MVTKDEQRGAAAVATKTDTCQNLGNTPLPRLPALADVLTHLQTHSDLPLCGSMCMAQYEATGHMHEKYDVSAADGGVGRGGEYAPQVGFGWSNGVVLAFMESFCV